MRRRARAPEGRASILWACCLSVFVAGAVVSVSAQQQAATLLIAADGPTAFDSRLYRLDTVSGRVETLFSQQMGRFSDIVMDRDNVGFTAVWQGPVSSGLHFMTANGGVASIHHTVATVGPKLSCVNLTTEDVWAVGTRQELGRSRLRGLVPGTRQFVDVDNFGGASIDRLLIERQQARYIFAMNGPGGGALLSYNVYHRASQTTIATNLGTITDIDQDPYSGVYLVSTRTKSSPLTMVLPIGNQSIVSSFSFPANVFPQGVDVEGMALGVRGNGQHAPLWVVAGGRVWTLRWNSDEMRVEFPVPLRSVPIPAGGVNGMIVEGDRDFLLTTAQIAPNQWVLKLRLGPALAHKPYVIGASLAPTPGIKIGDGRLINLRPDYFFFLVNQGQMATIFQDFVGKTDGAGEVTGSVKATQSWRRALAGLTVYFAGVVLDPGVPGGVRTISNTVGFQLQ